MSNSAKAKSVLTHLEALNESHESPTVILDILNETLRAAKSLAESIIDGGDDHNSGERVNISDAA